MANKHTGCRKPGEKFYGKTGLTIEVRNGNVEGAIKALKKRIMTEGVLKDIRKHEFYEKPTARRRREKAESRKRWIKMQKQAQRDGLT